MTRGRGSGVGLIAEGVLGATSGTVVSGKSGNASGSAMLSGLAVAALAAGADGSEMTVTAPEVGVAWAGFTRLPSNPIPARQPMPGKSNERCQESKAVCAALSDRVITLSFYIVWEVGDRV